MTLQAEAGERRRGDENTGRLIFCIGRYKVRTRLFVQIKRRVLHAQGLENTLLNKLVEGHTTDHFNNVRRDIDTRLRVFPARAWLVLHRRTEIKRDKITQAMSVPYRGNIGFAETGRMSEHLLNRDLSGLT